MSAQRVEFVSKAEFQRRTGLGATRLKKLISEGLPVGRNRKIPVKRALAWIEANVDPARKNGWQGAAKVDHGQNSEASLNDFRRQREEQKVEAGKIELAKVKGELIERAAVKKFLADRARMERDQWLSWASAVAGRLAGPLGVDAGRLFPELEREVREQLRLIAETPLEMAQTIR